MIGNDNYSLEIRQKQSGVKQMGIQAGVSDTQNFPYEDEEVIVEYCKLESGEELNQSKVDIHRFLVFGTGRGYVNNMILTPGKLLIIPPEIPLTINADERCGINFFIVRVKGARFGIREIALHDRVPLTPFYEEKIIVPKGTPFNVDSVLNLGEVIVPPGIKTSKHTLGVNERYLVFGGPAAMFLDDVQHFVTMGNIVHIPSGTIQSIKNTSLQPLRFYCLCTPPFTPDTYEGIKSNEIPNEFDLDAWWKANSQEFI